MSERIDTARNGLRTELQELLQQERELKREREQIQAALAALGDDAPPRRAQTDRGVVVEAAKSLLDNWPKGKELTAEQAADMKKVHPTSMGRYLRRAAKEGKLVTRRKGRKVLYRPNENGSAKGLKFNPGQREPVDATA